MALAKQVIDTQLCPIIEADDVFSRDLQGLEMQSLRVDQNDQTPISFDLSNSVLTGTEQQDFCALLKSYRHIFATNIGELGKAALGPHGIETGNAKPVTQRY